MARSGEGAVLRNALARLGLAPAILVGGAALCNTPDALAADLVDIKICNNYTAGIYVAIAYPQSGGGWISRGWLSVPTGACSFFDTGLHVSTFYIRAETGWYTTSRRRRSREVWGGKGDRAFAVVDNSSGSFNYYQAETKVRGIPNEQFVQFFSGGNLTLSGDARATVTFNADGTITSNVVPVTPPVQTPPVQTPPSTPTPSPSYQPPPSSASSGKNNSGD